MSRLILPARGGWSRREFLRTSFLSAGAVGAASWLSACGGGSDNPSGGSRFADIGALQEPDANGLRLPRGFSSRVVAVSGENPVAGGSYAWHDAPDGGATFATEDGGWIYANNSEVPLLGGVGALKFDQAGNVVDAYRILALTTANCAGGPTPWGTWLSCEEFDLGQVWETNPYGSMLDARARPALGIFKHEAVAVDPDQRILYLTEDAGDGRFYRFVPSATDWPAGAARPALQSGSLQVLKFKELEGNLYPPDDFNLAQSRAVEWVDAQSPALPQGLARGPGSIFKGGEGLWWFEGIVYFSTKGDNRIWAYDPAAQTLESIYHFDSAAEPNNVLRGVDNLTVSRQGDVLVAEDGGDMQLCVILPDRRVLPLLQLTGQDDSEITGPAFSPDGRRLYFNSQRGARNGAGSGITYEITLPFSA